jgi:hypothetical protein
MKKIKEALYAPLLEEKKSKNTTAVPYTADRNVNESDIAEELLAFETSQSLMKIMLDDDTIIHKETEKLFRVTLDSSQSSFLLIDETYSIMSEITSLIEFLKLPETFEGSTHTIINLIFNTRFAMADLPVALTTSGKKRFERIFHDPNDSEYDNTHTKGEWLREYHSICNKYLLSQEAQNGIIKLIFSTRFAMADLPVALTTSGKKRFKRIFHDPNDSEYDNTHTKGEWLKEYHSICNKYLLSQEAQNGIINLIFKTGFTTADLPVALTTSGKKRFKRIFHDPNMIIVMTLVFSLPILCQK